jgi:predicted aconitase with swiveling domain
MATIAISALPVATSQAGADVLPIVQATTNTTKQLSIANLFTSPTLVTPVLGTVVSGNISACTSTSMALTTPVIGAATGTSLSTTGNQVISSTGKHGYATGSGGTITQGTSKATAVTLSKPTGQITLNNAALAADTTVSFTLLNTVIEAGDILVMNHISGGTAGSYLLNAQSAAGSAIINVRNITTGSLSEAIVIAFAVIKAVTA